VNSRALRAKRVAWNVVAVGVIAVVFGSLLPRLAEYREVGAVFRTLSAARLLALLGVASINLATCPPSWMVSLPGLRFRQAFDVSQAFAASTYVVPGGAAPGMAVSFAMLERRGFDRAPVMLAIALIGIWNQLVLFAFPIFALGLLTVSGVTHRPLQAAAALGMAFFVAVVMAHAAGLSSERAARRMGDLASRAASRLRRLFKAPTAVSWDGATLVRFRRAAVELLRRRWGSLTAATLLGHLTVFGVLLVSLRALDVSAGELSWGKAFAAWTLARLVGSLPITPGGLGVVELALSSLLVALGAAPAPVVAAVLVYRFLTVIPTLLLGVTAMATWRTHPRSER
jgi:uncharacterized protein (TIRG00374 family)